MRSLTRIAAIFAAVALVLALAAGAARADGDPASDVLYQGRLFIPQGAPISKTVKQQLAATVATAWKSGFKIKVAVIGSPYDLGSVTALWLKPRIYAHFLWQEIQFYFKGRLLVAMPNGFGIYNGAKSVQGDEKVLAKIHHGDDPNSFVSSVTAAVRALAAAHGHTLK